MSRVLGRAGAIALVLVTLGAGGPAAGRPKPASDTPDVPAALAPWVGWVLHGHDAERCPPAEADTTTRCVWPSRLGLALDARGGRFEQRFRTFARTWVALPGSGERWPLAVKVGGKAAVVVEREGAPSVELEAGEHVVSGAFAWDTVPEALPIPKETGLLELSVRGRRVPSPHRDDEGRVWLERESGGSEPEVLEVLVYRRVTDEIPLLVTTRLELRVSGKNREVLLGRALPAGLVPVSIQGPLPARLEPDGRLRLQVRPGSHTLTIVARHDGPAAALARPEPGGPWSDRDEVWVFEARPALRVATVEGVPLVDPQQTTLPADWRSLPAYVVAKGASMKLVEQRRGDADPAPDKLVLHRDLWLDFDGRGYSVSDRLSGALSKSWRLEVDPPLELGRVAVSGRDQTITRRKDGKVGVEIRQGRLDVTADGRLPHAGAVPAVGWAADFHEVSGTLHVPPGYRLFHASGADEVPGTWIRLWTLLDLFLVLVVAAAAGRLFGWRWGVLALLGVGLALHEHGAPRWLWIVLLALEALARALASTRVAPWARRVRLGVLVWLVLVAVPFSIGQVRVGLFPALDEPGGRDSGILDQLAMQKEATVTLDVPSAGEQNAPSGVAQAIDGKSNVGQFELRNTDEESSKNVAGKKDKAGFKAQRKKGKESFATTTSDLNVVLQERVSNSDYQQYVRQVDPNATVQTGQGLPKWSWRDVPLKWSGPVEHGQVLHLYWLSPGANLVLSLLRVLLLALLVVRFGRLDERIWPRAPWLGVAAATALLLAPGAARADLPSEELLEALRARLLEPARCRPHCATSPRMALEVRGQSVRARVEVLAAAPTAVRLPGQRGQWSRVLLDGKPAPALREEGARLEIALPAGPHEVLLEGELADLEAVQIPLGLRPRRVEAKVDGWRLEGLHEDGVADDSLQLTRERKQPAAAGTNAPPPPLPPFVRVEREVHLGLEWAVDTRVVRLSPPEAAIVLEVPLLAGESVTTAGARVEKGRALVNMAPGQSAVTWHSLLREAPQIKLEAPRALPWSEVWVLDASSVWHVALGGIPVVHQQAPEGVRRPEWRPWPGETATIDVTRPEGLPGQTVTIDRSKLDLKPGLRATDAVLELHVRSSRGAQHTLVLPEHAMLQQVTIGGAVQPIRLEGRKLTVPLVPGAQEVRVEYRVAHGLGTSYTTPGIDLGAASVNATLEVQVPHDRWVLLCGGPRLGPAVLFWSLLLVLALVAYGLSRVGKVGGPAETPLRTHDWLLLGLGLSQVPIFAAAIVAGWPLLLAVRRRRAERGEPEGWFWFDVTQLVLVALTLAAFGVLVGAIHEGLLGRPDMQIRGGGSSGELLRWFQDRPGQAPAGAWVLSVPLLAYRLAMLLWALWLARALIGWLRWAWDSFGAGGVWRRRPPRPKKDKPAPAAATAAAPPAPDVPPKEPSLDPPQ